MRILKMEQNSEVWLDYRRGKITGSKNKDVRPLSRGADRTPQGVWKLVAERLAVAPDGEKEMDRGHRCESDAIARLVDVIDKPFETDAGIWVSETSEDVMLSPDASAPYLDDKLDVPTYAAEIKCLNSDNHLKYIYKDKLARINNKDLYNPIDSVPKEYRDQALGYFAINPKLETLYFCFFDDRLSEPSLEFHYLEIKREHIAEEAEALTAMQNQTLKFVDDIIEFLTED